MAVPVAEVVANRLAPRLTRSDLIRKAFQGLPKETPTFPTVPPRPPVRGLLTQDLREAAKDAHQQASHPPRVGDLLLGDLLLGLGAPVERLHHVSAKVGAHGLPHRPS